MKPLLILALLLVTVFLGCAISKADTSHEQTVREYINNVYLPGTALMYQRTSEAGGKAYICTSSAFAKVQEGYLFLSAAHCVTAATDVLYISPDSPNPEMYYPAEIVAYGDQNLDLDFSVLYVKAPDGAFAIVPLGHNPTQAGESVLAISSPSAMGKLVLRGFIAMVKSNHHMAFLAGGYKIDWIGDIVFSMPGTGPGSSGSALICEDQMAVCGILSGHTTTMTIAQPIEKFYEWWSLVQTGKMNPRPLIPVFKVDLPKK